MKTTGTDIDKLMPPVSRFGGSGRAARKQTVVDKLRAFFEKYFGIGSGLAQEESTDIEEHDVPVARLYDLPKEASIRMATEEKQKDL